VVEDGRERALCALVTCRGKVQIRGKGQNAAKGSGAGRGVSVGAGSGAAKERVVVVGRVRGLRGEGGQSDGVKRRVGVAEGVDVRRGRVKGGVTVGDRGEGLEDFGVGRPDGDEGGAVVVEEVGAGEVREELAQRGEGLKGGGEEGRGGDGEGGGEAVAAHARG